MQRSVILRSRTRFLGGQNNMAQLPKEKHITYQLQYRKCGKPNCSTCRTGRGHGPYWYAYWHEGTRLRSSYIGKTLPQANVSNAPSAAPPQSKHDTSPPEDPCKPDHPCFQHASSRWLLLQTTAQERDSQGKAQAADTQPLAIL